MKRYFRIIKRWLLRLTSLNRFYDTFVRGMWMLGEWICCNMTDNTLIDLQFENTWGVLLSRRFPVDCKRKESNSVKPAYSLMKNVPNFPWKNVVTLLIAPLRPLRYLLVFSRFFFKRRGHRNATQRPQRNAVNNLPFVYFLGILLCAKKRLLRRREVSETCHRKFIWPFFIQTLHIKYIPTLPWTMDHRLWTFHTLQT